MDFAQTKLTKLEWDSIERPVSIDEKIVLNLIKNGFHNVLLNRNETLSILQYLKINNNDSIDLYIFIKYLQPDIVNVLANTTINYKPRVEGRQRIRKCDKYRLCNSEKKINSYKNTLFEFIIVDLMGQMIRRHQKKNKLWYVDYYTLNTILTYNVINVNRSLLVALQDILKQLDNEINIPSLVYYSQELIETNPYLLKYADMSLYEHQRRIFTVVKQNNNPKLILYIAPTGTGKTLTPIGLTEEKRVIFVCAARHVGLSLAKAAISSEKKIAFAFGCNTAEDIRLHYSAAKNYTRDFKSGRIRKVDNTVGDKVELMICDVRSYIPAMLYMTAFNNVEDIVTYWDEPTISLDYEEHDFHSLIQRNWKENIIPTFVLSSATLPQQDEIIETLQDFRSRFNNAEIISIISHDCKKTIPLINTKGYIEMPHFIFKDYNDIRACVKHCERNKTLLRYIDLGEATRFIKLVNEQFSHAITSRRYKIDMNFSKLEDVNMNSIKMYYITLLGTLRPEYWIEIQKALITDRTPRHPSNIHIVTSDAHTLTDGPTIFLANNVDLIAKFYIQSAKIPKIVISRIMKIITHNNIINEKIAIIEKKIADKTANDIDSGNTRKLERESVDIKTLRQNLEKLEAYIESVELSPAYVPNTLEHLRRFIENPHNSRAYCSDISDDTIERIMLINDVEDMWKLLLMMGIGVFAEHKSIEYTEVMKYLAQEQKLYVIIASPDYIYGTNYQFCHAYISKDLATISQEKIIQAMGRVGRNKLQFDYSIRFRDDLLIQRLFTKEDNKPEVINMRKLFCS